MSMHCPRDPAQELSQIAGGADAFTCDRCGGMFFTAGELDRLAEPHQGTPRVLDGRPRQLRARGSPRSRELPRSTAPR